MEFEEKSSMESEKIEEVGFVTSPDDLKGNQNVTANISSLGLLGSLSDIVYLTRRCLTKTKNCMSLNKNKLIRHQEVHAKI